MIRLRKACHARGLKAIIPTVAALAGFATAALVGVALAKTFTLQVAQNAKVTDQSGSTRHENVAVTSRGFAVYDLTGDTKGHPECTKSSGCFKFWPPVTVSSPKKLSKAAGISGRLGVWRRAGVFQVTLAGHPLYRFAPDTQKGHATGEGVKSFGGTWHVIQAAGSAAGGTTTSPGTTTMTTMTTTTTTTMTTPCLYPPCP